MILLLILLTITQCQLPHHCCTRKIENYDSTICINASQFEINCSSIYGKYYCEGMTDKKQITGRTESIYCKNIINTTEQSIYENYTSYSKNCMKCKGSSCSGTGAYCSRHKCKGSSECYCEQHNLQNVLSHNVNGIWKLANRTNIFCDLIYYPEPSINKRAIIGKSNLSYILNGEKMIVKRQSSGISVSWNQPKITIYNPEWEGSSVVLNKLSFNLEVGMTNVNKVILIPNSWLKSPDSIILQIYHNQEVVVTQSLSVVVSTGCEQPFDCYFCMEPMDRFECLNTFVQAVFIIVCITCCVILIGIAVGCVKFMLNCSNGFQTQQVTAVSILMMSFKLVGASNSNKIAGIDIKWILLILIAPLNKFFKILLILSILLFVSNAQVVTPTPTTIPIEQKCDASVQISSNEISCLRSQNKQICKVSAQILATLPFPGTTLCYVVTDNENSGVLGHIEVAYVKSVLSAQLLLQYWTSSWKLQTCSGTSCPNSNHCNGDLNCDKFAELGKFNANYVSCYGECSGTCAMFPGQSNCQSSCACAGCGCFYCTSACTYGRWALAADKTDIWSVYRIGNFFRYPTLQICYVDTNGNRKCTIQQLESSSATGFSDNFTVTILGTVAAGNIQVPKDNVVIKSDNSKKAFAKACDANVPCATGIGDIQSASYTSIANPTFNSYIFPPDMCTPSVSGHSQTFTCPASGFNVQRPTLMNFPVSANSINWDIDSLSNLIGVEMNPGVLLISISAVNITFTRIVNEICPTMKLLSTKGQFADTAGAWFNVEADSTCLPGSCVLNGDGITIVTPSLNLTTTAKNFMIRFTSSLKQVSGRVRCTAGEHSAFFDFSATLDDPTIILNPNNTQSGSSSAQEFWDSLSLAAQIGLGIGCSLGFLLLLGLVILLLVGVFYWEWGSKLSSGYSKIEERAKTPEDEDNLVTNDTDNAY